MFEPIIEDDILYLSQSDLFVNMFGTLWSNFLYNGNGYMHIHDYDYPWEDVNYDIAHSLIDSLYNSATEEYDDEIKNGTAYASDGVHLYNRVSDKNSSLGYTDNYVYTLATPYDELYIPDGKVFTQKGNYLYDGDTKAYASISVLKSCDTRISEIKTYVEKSIMKAYSNNEITEAYKNMLITNEVNSVVNEYIEVKRAKKEFSNVNEQRSTYVLKTGSKGEKVTKLQQQLYELGFFDQMVTGEYGSITASNVAYFQVINGLKVTGWVNDETYNQILGTEEMIIEPKDTTPYAYPTNLQEGMEVVKGSYSFNVVGNENCDGIRLTMYSTTLFNDGLSQWYNYDGNDVNGYFDCTDVGSYTLMVESRNDSTGETFQYGMNFEVVDTTTGGDLYAYYMLGIWDAIVDSCKGVWTNIKHPIQTVTSTANGIIFLTKALTPWGGEERQALLDLWTTALYDTINNAATKEAKETARAYGKFMGEVAITVLVTVGVDKGLTALKEAARSGKLGKAGLACIKAKDKADDFVNETITIMSNKAIADKALENIDDIIRKIDDDTLFDYQGLSKTIADSYGDTLKTTKLLEELSECGEKVSMDKVIAVMKDPTGKLIWLEQGNKDTAGLWHILKRHSKNFLDKGIAVKDIPNFVTDLVQNGNLVNEVAESGKRTYKVVFDNGVEELFDVVVGPNGFIVTAYPTRN